MSSVEKAYLSLETQTLEKPGTELEHSLRHSRWHKRQFTVIKLTWSQDEENVSENQQVIQTGTRNREQQQIGNYSLYMLGANEHLRSSCVERHPITRAVGSTEEGNSLRISSGQVWNDWLWKMTQYKVGASFPHLCLSLKTLRKLRCL